MPNKPGPQHDLALYKYALNFVWTELCKHSGECEICTSAGDIKIALSRLCSELGIKIRLDKD